MKTKNSIIKTFTAVAFVLCLSVTAKAQIGTGWIPTTESFVVKTANGGTVIPFLFPQPNGVFFRIPFEIGIAVYQYSNLSPYTSEQLQAYLTVDALGGYGPGVLQTGPCVIALHKQPAYLYDAQSGRPLWGYTVGMPLQINTIYTPVTGTVDVYVNGIGVEERTISSLPIYNAVGVWAPATSASAGPATVTWRSIQFWKGGRR